MGTRRTNFYVSSENAWASPAPLLWVSPQHVQVGPTSGKEFHVCSSFCSCISSLCLTAEPVCLPSPRGSETWPSTALVRRGKYLMLTPVSVIHQKPLSLSLLCNFRNNEDSSQITSTFSSVWQLLACLWYNKLIWLLYINPFMHEWLKH